MLMSPQTPLTALISLMKNLVLICLLFIFLVGLQAPSARWEKKNQQRAKEFAGTVLQQFVRSSRVSIRGIPH